MKRSLALMGLLFAVGETLAARHVGFQTDAFNRAYPANYSKSMIFSPASFELDCAIVAESLATIPKANVAETMGVVLDFASTFKPVIEAVTLRTNGLDVVSARGFCVPELKKCAPAFRQFLEWTYGAEVMPSFPPEGAERWFRASLDGEMEDFSLPRDLNSSERYSFYDLIAVSAEWEEPFPTANTREVAFHPDDSTNVVAVTCMSDVREADTWENQDYTLLKLPLKGGAVFYAFLPQPGSDLMPVKQDISSLEINHLLSVTKSVTEKGVSHGPCAIVLPRLELYSRANFSSILTYFRIPAQGLVHVDAKSTAREHLQFARFRLLEHGRLERPIVRKDAAKVVPIGPTTKKLVFNRPFLFFVYHESTASILIAGQFFGR